MTRADELEGLIERLRGGIPTRKWDGIVIDVDMLAIQSERTEAADALARHAALLKEAREVVEPFARAARALEDDLTPAGLHCPDDYIIEVAVHEGDQPTVGNLRRARAFLDKTGDR